MTVWWSEVKTNLSRAYRVHTQTAAYIHNNTLLLLKKEVHGKIKTQWARMMSQIDIYFITLVHKNFTH